MQLSGTYMQSKQKYIKNKKFSAHYKNIANKERTFLTFYIIEI